MIKSARFHKIQCLFVLQESFQQLWHYKRVAAQVFYMTLHLAFSDLLAFGSVKIAKIEFFIKGAQFFIKSAKSRSFFSGGFSRNNVK